MTQTKSIAPVQRILIENVMQHALTLKAHAPCDSCASTTVQKKTRTMLKTDVFARFSAQLAAIPRTHQRHDACLLPSVLQTIHSRYEDSAKNTVFS